MSDFQPVIPDDSDEFIETSSPTATPDEPLQETMSVAGVARRGNTYLMAHRAPENGGDLADKWEFIGGKVSNHEAPAAALKREFLEELGVNIRVGPLFYRGSFQHKEVHFTLQAYLVGLVSDDFTLDEHDNVAWVTIEEMADLDMASSDYGIFEYLLYHLDGPDDFTS
ncbi:MAG: (deoxy)nucleoside triphosphate pyrophosphohydrolase [Spirochaetales bacterium]